MSRSGEKIPRQQLDDESSVDPLLELESSAKAQLEQLLSKRLANHQAVQAASQAPKDTLTLKVSQLALLHSCTYSCSCNFVMAFAPVPQTAMWPGQDPKIFPQASSLSVAALCTDHYTSSGPPIWHRDTRGSL